VSIKKIAEMAGVSIGTVDRALNGRGRVSTETKEKIERIARQINYQPNLMASLLSKKRKASIAILIPKPENDDYWQQAWTGFERIISKAERQGLKIKNYFYSLDDQKSFDKLAKKITVEKPDGLILAPNHPESSARLATICAQANIPVVLFDSNLPNHRPLCFVGTDLRQSGMVCGQLLEKITPPTGGLGLFHIDSLPTQSHDIMEKEIGFYDYMKSSQPKRFVETFTINSHRNLEQQLDAAFARNISGCLVSNSKTWIIGNYLKRHQRNDIRLIGFDLIEKNVELLKEGWIDFLINQNPERQARKSLNKFINHFAFGESTAERDYLPIEIITKHNLLYT
jgi:LacI family transcriptional regulator